jgi:hypothetical protein
VAQAVHRRDPQAGEDDPDLPEHRLGGAAHWSPLRRDLGGVVYRLPLPEDGRVLGVAGRAAVRRTRLRRAP